ncbi:MAG TPA: A/G-specific adenine glycosylase [Candidatus Paceibacterota bacterium]
MRKRLSGTEIAHFRRVVRAFYLKNKRDLPWRKASDPYHVLVSEIMLQQTQVSRVCQKFPFFISTFPTIKSLAKAPLREVLSIWSGLGYNRRAKFLHELAKIVMNDYGGEIPREISALVELPGLGRATAASFLAFAFNQPTVFVETNIRSVFLFHFFKNKKNVSDKEILLLIEQTVDRKNPREWYSALMDYGTVLKERYGNPNIKSAHHVQQKRFTGSRRQLRGEIVRACLRRRPFSVKELSLETKKPSSEVREVLKILEGEGFLKIRGGKIVFTG